MQGNWNGWRVLTAGLIAVYFDLLLQFTLWIALTLPSLLTNWKWVITIDCWMWWQPPFQWRKVAFCFAYVKLINNSNLNGEEPIRTEYWKLLFHQCTKQNQIKSEVAFSEWCPEASGLNILFSENKVHNSYLMQSLCLQMLPLFTHPYIVPNSWLYLFVSNTEGDFSQKNVLWFGVYCTSQMYCFYEHFLS